MPVRAMRAAIIFMSRIPAGGFPYSEEEFRAAPGHFPFVGLLVGLCGAPLLLLAPRFGANLSAALALCVTVWVTGAFHEDGLADTADALGGAHSRKKIHDILKDSRIGTYGGSALVFSLLIRTLTLARLVDLLGVEFARALSAPALSAPALSAPALSAPAVFVLIHVLSRVGPVGLMASLPYVSEQGAKGSSVAKGGGIRQVLTALLWGVAALTAAYLVGLPISLGVLLLAVVFVVSSLLGMWFKRRAGGFTGDFLGATEQVLEMALLLTMVAVLSFEGAR